jgi:hypothetical protein
LARIRIMIQHYAISIMVYRKMLYFHWILDSKIYISDQMIKSDIRLPVLALFFYPIMAYQGTKCNFFELVGKINLVSWKNLD